jgi:hypothetical protein
MQQTKIFNALHNLVTACTDDKPRSTSPRCMEWFGEVPLPTPPVTDGSGCSRLATDARRGSSNPSMADAPTSFNRRRRQRSTLFGRFKTRPPERRASLLEGCRYGGSNRGHPSHCRRRRPACTKPAAEKTMDHNPRFA